MREIRTVGVVGLGALGTLYACLFTKALGKDRVFVLADPARAERLRRDGVFFNGEPCDFQYAGAAQLRRPVDLLLFAVKFGGLDSAVEAYRGAVGPETTLVSVLNGISSEEILGKAFSPEQVVWCVAQKMSARREGNRVTADPLGQLAVGVPAGIDEAHLRRLTAFFDRIGFDYDRPADIRARMWSKLMCNTGCNQAAMVYQCGYGQLQTPGPARDTMIAAMREVLALANAEGVPLTEEDLDGWLAVIDAFPPEGAPSMRQDALARRRSEVELFAGTVRRLSRRHGLPTPVNDRIYEAVREMEAAY